MIFLLYDVERAAKDAFFSFRNQFSDKVYFTSLHRAFTSTDFYSLSPTFPEGVANQIVRAVNRRINRGPLSDLHWSARRRKGRTDAG